MRRVEEKEGRIEGKGREDRGERKGGERGKGRKGGWKGRRERQRGGKGEQEG